MWRYYDNVDQPPAKKVKTPVQRKETQKKYEEGGRKRSFLDPWKVGRDWLVWEETEEGAGSGVMRCRVCLDAGKINPKILQKNVLAI